MIMDKNGFILLLHGTSDGMLCCAAISSDWLCMNSVVFVWIFRRPFVLDLLSLNVLVVRYCRSPISSYCSTILSVRQNPLLCCTAWACDIHDIDVQHQICRTAEVLTHLKNQLKQQHQFSYPKFQLHKIHSPRNSKKDRDLPG